MKREQFILTVIKMKKIFIKILSDPRTYYVISLLTILIWVPYDDYSRRKFPEFYGWEWVWYILSSAPSYQPNLSYLAIEFIFVTALYCIFKKNR